MKLETRGNPVSAVSETFLWLIIDWFMCFCKKSSSFLADVFSYLHGAVQGLNHLIDCDGLCMLWLK